MKCPMKARLLALLVMAVAAFNAAAQAWPAKPVQMVIPFPPGTPPDILARGFATVLDMRLGGRTVPVNRPGAGTALGMNAVATAPADGYTFIYTPITPLTIQLHRMDNLAYAIDSFVPICQAFEGLFVLASGPKVQFNDLQALIEHARANPGKLRYFTPGIATSLHLAGAELFLKAGARVTDVPFAGVEGIVAMLAGEPELGVVTVGQVAPNKLRAYAVFADQRTKNLPNVPTAKELGYPILPSGYGGVFVRSGTPEAVVSRLESLCAEVARDPKYIGVVENVVYEVNYLDRKAFGERIRADYQSKAALLKTLNLPK
jgi:tripartite-type tricarboxylate transporter receptor subunit TctC